MRFTTDADGLITGIRFYKGPTNTGTHIGSLWTSSGTRLATATFTGETATGWQQVNFATPVAVTANTVYVASYFAPNGNYAADSAYFASTGVDRPPIHLLQNGVGGGNGVYAYGASSSFPSSTYNSTNYWVDVVFTGAGSGPPDTTPPTVTASLPSSGATGVALGAAVSATFSEAIDVATLSTTTFVVTTPASAVVSGSVAYNAATKTYS